MAYEEEGDLFVRAEPTIRKLMMGKEGDLGLTFSN